MPVNEYRAIFETAPIKRTATVMPTPAATVTPVEPSDTNPYRAIFETAPVKSPELAIRPIPPAPYHPIAAGLKGAGQGLLSALPFSTEIAPADLPGATSFLTGTNRMIRGFTSGMGAVVGGSVGGTLVTGGNPVGGVVGGGVGSGAQSLIEQVRAKKAEAIGRGETPKGDLEYLNEVATSSQGISKAAIAAAGAMLGGLAGGAIVGGVTKGGQQIVKPVASKLGQMATNFGVNTAISVPQTVAESAVETGNGNLMQAIKGLPLTMGMNLAAELMGARGVKFKPSEIAELKAHFATEVSPETGAPVAGLIPLKPNAMPQADWDALPPAAKLKISENGNIPVEGGEPVASETGPTGQAYSGERGGVGEIPQEGQGNRVGAYQAPEEGVQPEAQGVAPNVPRDTLPDRLPRHDPGSYPLPEIPDATPIRPKYLPKQKGGDLNAQENAQGKAPEEGVLNPPAAPLENIPRAQGEPIPEAIPTRPEVLPEKPEPKAPEVKADASPYVEPEFSTEGIPKNLTSAIKAFANKLSGKKSGGVIPITPEEFKMLDARDFFHGRADLKMLFPVRKAQQSGFLDDPRKSTARTKGKTSTALGDLGEHLQAEGWGVRESPSDELLANPDQKITASWLGDMDMDTPHPLLGQRAAEREITDEDYADNAKTLLENAARNNETMPLDEFIDHQTAIKMAETGKDLPPTGQSINANEDWPEGTKLKIHGHEFEIGEKEGEGRVLKDDVDVQIPDDGRIPVDGPPKFPGGEQETATGEPMEGRAPMNADTERAQGFPIPPHERYSNEQANADATARLARDPDLGRKLTEDYSDNPRGFDNQLDQDIVTRYSSMKDAEYKETGDEEAFQEFSRANDVLVAGGREWGRTGQARRVALYDDFSIAGIRYNREKAAGRSLDPEEIAQAANDAAMIAEKEKAFIEAQIEKEVSERHKALKEAHDKLLAEVEALRKKKEPVVGPNAPQKPGSNGYGSRNKIISKDQADAARQALKDYFNRASAGVDPTILKPLVELGLFHFEAGAREFARWSKAMKDDLGAKADPMLAEVWDAARAKYHATRRQGIIDRAGARMEKGGEPGDIGRMAHELARSFVAEGVRDRDKLTDLVHSELKKVDPEMTREQAMDAISGYGQYRQLSKDEIDAQLRDLKGQLQQVGKLRDMQEKKAPSKTGVERRSPSDEERRLIQQVNEGKRRGGFKVTDPETQLATALGSIKTRMKNEISDMESQIASGEKIVKGKSVVMMDAEANALKARRDEVKARFDAAFPKEAKGRQPLSDEQKIKMATGAVEASIKDYEARIKAGNLGPRMSAPGPSTPELEALKARRDALKSELDELRDLAKPKLTKEQRENIAYERYVKNLIADIVEKKLYQYPPEAPKRRMTPGEKRKDKEVIRMEIERDKERKRIRERTEAMRKKSVGEKLWSLIPGTNNFAREVLSSIDVSAPGRQGFALGVAHPANFGKAYVSMWKSLFSESAAYRVKKDIESRANYNDYAKFKMLSDWSGEGSARNEFFQSPLAEKLPVVGRLFKGSARAYTTFMNKLRADSYDSILKSRLFKDTPEGRAAVADYINKATGKGGFGQFEQAVPLLSQFTYAPRNRWGNIQYLTAQPFFSGKGARSAIAAEYAKTMIGTAVVASLAAGAAYLNNKMGGPPVSIETDSTNADFGKLKIGDTRIDFGAGRLQPVVLGSRIYHGERKTASGKIVDIRGENRKYGERKPSELVLDYIKKGGSPIVGMAAELMDQEDAMGNPTTLTSTAINHLTPLAIQDIVDAMKAQGLTETAALAILAFHGVSIQTYKPRQPKITQRKTATTMPRMKSAHHAR